jgi:hypothetical protein
MIVKGGILDAYAPGLAIAPMPMPVAAFGWWFWVKAGMGFTFGAGIVTVTGVVLWTMLWVGGLVAILSHGRF